MTAWDEALEEARQAVGFTGRVVPRNLAAIRAALRPERLDALDNELSALSDGAGFDAFLDHWWTQALADAAADPEERERAIDFADLAVAFHVKRVGGRTYTQAEVEEMLKDIAS